MGLYDIVELRENLPLSFENDGFELTSEVMEKYKQSRLTIKNGQMMSQHTSFCKNASISDLTGTKIVWGGFWAKRC